MSFWDVDVFTTCKSWPGEPATEWSHVRTFCESYQNTCYFFMSTGQGNGPVQQNNAQAIKLIIEKCDALQTQIDDAGGGVDMDAILAAIWESTPLEIFFFVNYIDGMRASIWNKEIQETRLADIYRHFLT